MEKGAKVLSHWAARRTAPDKFSLAPVAPRLTELLGKDVDGAGLHRRRRRRVRRQVTDGDVLSSRTLLQGGGEERARVHGEARRAGDFVNVPSARRTARTARPRASPSTSRPRSRLPPRRSSITSRCRCGAEAPFAAIVGVKVLERVELRAHSLPPSPTSELASRPAPQGVVGSGDRVADGEGRQDRHRRRPVFTFLKARGGTGRRSSRRTLDLAKSSRRWRRRRASISSCLGRHRRRQVRRRRRDAGGLG